MRLREAQLACMILTRLPAGRLEGSAPPIASAVWAFPLVGALVGMIAGLVFTGATWLGLPALAAAFLALASSALVTGGLHEDGLADTADGFGGGQSVTRKLEIMRDSRIGSYGVLALIFVLALSASGIAASAKLVAFMVIGAVSRAAMLVPMTALRPARNDGLGHSAAVTIGPPVWGALAVTLGFCILGGAFLPVALMLATAVTLTALAHRQIGGQTGDVLGATQKLTECTGWLTLAALT